MTDSERGAGLDQTPQESGTIYSSIGIQGVKYRDFSASRREVRTQFRQWAAGAEPERKMQEQISAATAFTFGAEKNRAKQHSGSRWFALREIFATAGQSAGNQGEAIKPDHLPPALMVFSVAGGVGKSSLVATLGRILAAHGEHVLLVETTPLGLIPLFFGSREFRPGFKSGVVRSFSPPPGSTDAPVRAVTLDAEQYLQRGDGQLLLEVLIREARASNRILIDVQTASRSVAQLLSLAGMVLAPLLPDMNSVLSVAAVEAVFAGRADSAGNAIEPVYLLNQFDDSLPLHQDVRAILQQQLGPRLLPFVLRHSPEVNEALAEGMTVMDYAPNSSAVEDYIQLANWLGSVSPATSTGFRRVRWSER